MAGHVKQQESSRLMLEYDNAAGGRLSRFSMDPPTGFHRDGYCRVTDEDSANHSVAGIMTPGFLKFTNGKGNNLEKAGVKDGMKWCLCASRWKEAYDAFKSGDLKKEDVPKVALHATDKKALDVVSYKMLSEFKAEGEVGGSGGSLRRQNATIDPSTGRDQGGVKERDISGNRPGSDQHYGKTAEKNSSVSGAEAHNERSSKF